MGTTQLQEIKSPKSNRRKQSISNNEDGIAALFKPQEVETPDAIHIFQLQESQITGSNLFPKWHNRRKLNSRNNFGFYLKNCARLACVLPMHSNCLSNYCCNRTVQMSKSQMLGTCDNHNGTIILIKTMRNSMHLLSHCCGLYFQQYGSQIGDWYFPSSSRQYIPS